MKDFWKKYWWISIPILLVFIIILKVYPPENHLFYPKCSFYVLTGYKCSGCGNLRASHAILNGDFSTAWKYNPSIFFLVPYLLSGLVLQSMSSKSEKAASIFEKLYHGKVLLSVFVLLVIFAVLRNIYHF